MDEEIGFTEVGKTSLEIMFSLRGVVKTPLIVFEQGGVIVVQSVQFAEEDVEDPAKLHTKLLYTIVGLIRRLGLDELFVGYEGFYVMEEGAAVRVLIGTVYSGDDEQVWLAQTHGRTIGEWRDISDNQNRFGFEGLFKKAKAYLWN